MYSRVHCYSMIAMSLDASCWVNNRAMGVVHTQSNVKIGWVDARVVQGQGVCDKKVAVAELSCDRSIS